jgi:hypothetical protein
MDPSVNALGPEGINYRVKLAFTAGVTEGSLVFGSLRYLIRWWGRSVLFKNNESCPNGAPRLANCSNLLENNCH